jgi:hypothetical protein
LDTDGEYIDINNPPIPTPVTLTLDNDEGTSGTVGLSVVPFTITVFSLSLDPGQIVMISADVSSDQRVTYRLQTDTVWSDAPDSTAEGAKGFVVTGCDDSATLYILFVSGGDVDFSAVTIFIKQFTKDDSETCTCKTGTAPVIRHTTESARFRHIRSPRYDICTFISCQTRPSTSISIRYDLSVADVYESFVRSLIASAPSISILLDMENIALEERREDLPSWVPDVRRINFISYLVLTYRGSFTKRTCRKALALDFNF